LSAEHTLTNKDKVMGMTKYEVGIKKEKGKDQQPTSQVTE